MTEQNGTFQQNLNDKAEFQNLYIIKLLFAGDEAQRPEAEAVRARLEREFGPVDIVADVENSLSTFAIMESLVEYKDGKVPAQLLMGEITPFDREEVSALDRTQQWDCPQWEELLERCTHSVMLSDFLSAGLPYKQRCHNLAKWVDVALELYPACEAVWFAPSGKLLTRKQLEENPYEGDNRFLYGGLNLRFFNIQGQDGVMLVDTLGLYAVGLPDVQMHFHGLNPNDVVRHAFNIASYQFANNAPVENGETIAGFDANGINGAIKWGCQYEQALVQPVRDVLDICPGEYAAGGRQSGGEQEG